MKTIAPSAFWKTMAQRFGQPWFEKNGAKPTTAWTELLGRHDHDVIEGALLRLKDRPERVRGLPPTHTEFQALVIAEAKNRASATTLTAARGRWRSIVVAECMKCAGLLNIVSYGLTRLDQFPDHLQKLAMEKSEELVQDSCKQQEGGKPIAEISSSINREMWNFLKPWAQPGEHYIAHLSADVPRGTNNGNQAGPAPSDAAAVSSYAQEEFAE